MWHSVCITRYMRCDQCQKPMLQLRKKSFLERLRFRAIYYCIECPLVLKQARFLFDPAAQAGHSQMIPDHESTSLI